MALKEIMVIEDNLVELERIGLEFPGDKYHVIKLRGTVAGDRYLKSKKHVDVLITDLNMSNEYLDEDLKILTHGGSLTGWIWLYHKARHLFVSAPKIVIYSEFITELQDAMQVSNDPDELAYWDSILMLSKTDAVNGIDILNAEVEKMLKK